MPINSFLYPGAKTTPAYEVANSLRFNDDDSAFLSKTFSGDGTSHDKGTVSFWMKRSELGAEQGLFTAGSSGRHFIRIESGDTLTFRATTDSFHIQTTQLFRDISAWSHIVIAFDTTQSTASNRVKFYHNGSQITDFSQTDYPDQNLDIKLGAAELNAIGKDSEQTNPYYDGYMAEFVYIDGQQLTPTSFGEFDEDSPTIWKPKSVLGLTFGTNGFYLDFEDSGTLGNDVSGNNNDFASSGLAATDQSTDTCTNNFATLNPLNVPTSNAPTFAEGNLKTTCAITGGAYMGSATIGVSTGKWYAEMKIKTVDSVIAGISANASEDARDSVYPGQQGYSVGILLNNGNKYISDSGSTHGAALSADDILMIALDLDNNNVYFGKNGSWFDGSGNADESNPNSAISITASSSTTDGFYFFSVGDGGGSAAGAAEWNFGSPAFSISSGNADANGHGNFEYSVPTGYFALNSKNLAEFG